MYIRVVLTDIVLSIIVTLTEGICVSVVVT